jgi:hypothetical protein
VSIETPPCGGDVAEGLLIRALHSQENDCAKAFARITSPSQVASYARREFTCRSRYRANRFRRSACQSYRWGGSRHHHQRYHQQGQYRQRQHPRPFIDPPQQQCHFTDRRHPHRKRDPRAWRGYRRHHDPVIGRHWRAQSYGTPGCPLASQSIPHPYRRMPTPHIDERR